MLPMGNKNETWDGQIERVAPFATSVGNSEWTVLTPAVGGGPSLVLKVLCVDGSWAVSDSGAAFAHLDPYHRQGDVYQHVVRMLDGLNVFVRTDKHMLLHTNTRPPTSENFASMAAAMWAVGSLVR